VTRSTRAVATRLIVISTTKSAASTVRVAVIRKMVARRRSRSATSSTKPFAKATVLIANSVAFY
jgi:hypothetical protein